MPSRKKKQKGRGESKQKKEMRQLANATAEELVRGIHDGKPAATLALLHQFAAASEGGALFDKLERAAGITEAMLKNLKRCDESLTSVFGAHDEQVDPLLIKSIPEFCLSTLLTGATQPHDRKEVYRKIAEGISPVIKCMVHEGRVFFQSTEAWYESESI